MAFKHRLVSAWFPKSLELRARRRERSSAVVLMYHEVLPDELDLPLWSIVRESAFRAQMAYLQQHYEVVSMDTALARMSGGEDDSHSSSPTMVVITFDDGYAGNLNCAGSILREFGLPFTVYIATAKVESGGCHWYDEISTALMTLGRGSLRIATSRGSLAYSGRYYLPDRRWAAIHRILTALKEISPEERELIATRLPKPDAKSPLRMLTPAEVTTLAAEPLATVGCHTHDHDLLDRMPTEQARASIARAQELLYNWTGYHPSHFSYPNGNYSLPVVELVREFGFASAVTTCHRAWTRRDDRHKIPRIGIGRFDNLNLFRAKVAGLFAMAILVLA